MDCGTRIFIEQADGSVKRYPGSGASQRAVSRVIFFDMYEIVCRGRTGTAVGDPKGWTQNFKIGS